MAQQSRALVTLPEDLPRTPAPGALMPSSSFGEGCSGGGIHIRIKREGGRRRERDRET